MARTDSSRPDTTALVVAELQRQLPTSFSAAGVPTENLCSRRELAVPDAAILSHEKSIHANPMKV